MSKLFFEEITVDNDGAGSKSMDKKDNCGSYRYNKNIFLIGFQNDGMQPAACMQITDARVHIMCCPTSASSSAVAAAVPPSAPAAHCAHRRLQAVVVQSLMKFAAACPPHVLAVVAAAAASMVNRCCRCKRRSAARRTMANTLHAPDSACCTLQYPLEVVAEIVPRQSRFLRRPYPPSPLQWVA